MIEPNEENEIWRNQQDWNLINWKLHNFCGVHVLLMNTGFVIHMMVKKKYPLSQDILSKMLSRRLEVDHQSEMGYELIRFVKSQVKTVNEERQIQALVDKKKVIISEISIRSDLKLDDAEGTDCLPTATIFAKLERMGAKTTSWNEFSSTMASAIICLATNQKFNLSKYIFDNMVKNLDGGVKFLMYLRFVQVFLDKQVEGMCKHKGIYVTPSHTKKVFANMKRPCKGFSRRVTPLFSTMMVQATKDMGSDSSTPPDSHSTPIITQPSSSKPQKKKIKKEIKEG
ncbi:hypothetical protein Tco_0150853 [Tanacetum coccineum]